MQKLLLSAALLLPGALAQAQTTIKITMPDTTTCTYATGQVSSNATPGQLQASATGPGTGAGCGVQGAVGGAVSFGPASPVTATQPNLPSSFPATSGESTTVTFQAVNAVSCTGSITGAAGGTFPGGSTLCTGAAACAALQTVGVAFPVNSDTAATKTYTVKATCSDANNQTASSSADITIGKAGQVTAGACPKVIPGSGSVPSFVSTGPSTSFNYYSGGVQLIDPSLFSNIFKSAWPGNFGLFATATLDNNKYISAQFHVPQNYMTAANAPANLYGEYTIGETDASAPVTITISTQCGDFAPPASGSSVVPGCYKNKLVADQFLAWTKSSSCALQNDTTYYLNIINADVANLTPTGGTATSTANAQCSGGHCTVPVSNGPGSWAGYTPN